MSTSQRAMTPCGWGVKAGMVRVWVAGKTVWSRCYTRLISKRFRDKGLTYKVLFKFIGLIYFAWQRRNSQGIVPGRKKCQGEKKHLEELSVGEYPGNCGENVWGMSWWPCRITVCAVVMACATLVNTQTHRQLLTGYTISSASGASKHLLRTVLYEANVVRRTHSTTFRN